ncbi:MAG: Glutamate synthase domain 2 [Candidatus Alkanophagales archaeon MCA70_species_2]|nr:Glutamate synthase domain 2 [Candidatus Alkanophaga liquidiphilum]
MNELGEMFKGVNKMGNLRRPNANDATGKFNRSRNVVPMSGLCTRCIDGCKGEVWLASFRGREVLYPRPLGR